MNNKLKKGVLTLFLFYSLKAFATNIPVYIDANKIIREKDKVIGIGNVVIKKGEEELIADKVIYYPDKDLAKFKGNIKIKTKDFKGSGSYGWWNFKKNEGEIYDVKGVLNNGYYFKAKKVKKLKDRFYFNNLEISKCPFDQYDWYIASSSGDFKENDYIHAKNATFRFCKIPILYTPYFAYPTSRRKSGFLVPTFSTNTYNNYILRIPYFYVINRTSDTTITLDFRDKQGTGINLEYRNRFQRDSMLNMNFFYFKEKKAGEWWEGRDFTPLKNRWRIYGNTSFKYDKFKVLFKIDLPSDPYFFEDYGAAASSVLPFSQISQRYLSYTKTQLFAIYDNKDFSTEINAEYIYDLTKTNNEETLQRLPEIRFYLKKKPLIKQLGIYFDFLSYNTYFYREKGLKGFRSDNTLYLYHFTNLWKFSNILEVKPRFTQYLNIKDTNKPQQFNDADKSRFLISVEDRLRLVEYRNYKNFIHSIIPQIAFYYTPKINQENYPQFDKEDRINERKEIHFSLYNILDFKNNDFLRWEITQGYSLMDYYYIGDNIYTGSRWIPLKNSIYLKIDRWSLDHTIFFSWDNHRITNSYTTLGVNILENLNYSVSHVYTAGNNHQISNRLSAKIKNFHIRASILNNLKYGYVQQKRFSFVWDRGCWNLEFAYIEDYNRTTDQRFRSYYILINILNTPFNIYSASNKQ